ncbi:MAG: ABC transporter substrate-binding protein [Alphaproteobacteria bacterium]|nr:ABC transporter substrate-binding protein [Alphaproteobacteria bacterium]
MKRSLAALVLLLALPATAETFRHGLSTFGDLKYGPDFKHYDYVNPDAPKGGLLRLNTVAPYDSLNPFILKGVAAPGIGTLWMTLMSGSADEPDSAYGTVAESVAVADDKKSVTFVLRKAARWHDGKPITAEDAVFSFTTLVEKGHPHYALLYRDIAAVEALAPDRARFRFKDGAVLRDLPLLAAGMPILPKHYYEKVAFERTTLEPPLGSGPYRVAKVDAGRSIVYERVADWWAKDLPTSRGRYNFDQLRFDVYRDRDIAFEAFKAGEYDWREEFTARNWATGYDAPAVKSGWIKRDTLPDATPSGVQAYFFNTRRAKFQDPRVRRAIGLAFDYEWTNKTQFHGLYERMGSMFENSDLKAKGKPSEAEVELLAPFRDRLAQEVFGEAYLPPGTDGSGNARENLRAARDLLTQAGLVIKDGKLLDKGGQHFALEILGFEHSFERIHAPFVKNLERLGIKASMRFVDVPQYKARMDAFDFDVTVQRFVQPLTPGIEQINMWGTQAADTPGSNNVAGIKSPVIDALIDQLMKASSRADLRAATHALDRVLMHGHYIVPQWFKGAHNIAYWDRFGRPKIAPAYAMGFPDTWWLDAERDAALRKATGKN